MNDKPRTGIAAIGMILRPVGAIAALLLASCFRGEPPANPTFTVTSTESGQLYTQYSATLNEFGFELLRGSDLDSGQRLVRMSDFIRDRTEIRLTLIVSQQLMNLSISGASVDSLSALTEPFCLLVLARAESSDARVQISNIDDSDLGPNCIRAAASMTSPIE